MVYRGCVVKIEKDFAVVMTNTMEYLKVIKKGGLRVGGKIMFVSEDLYREKSMSYKPILSIAAVLIIMIMSVTLSGLFQFTGYVANGAAAVVSLDINPSMEFEVNKDSKVIRVVPLNKEAKELVDMDMKGMNIQEAIWVIISKAKIKNYITKDKNSVLISTAILQEDFYLDPIELEEKTEAKWMEDNQNIELNLIYVEGNGDDLKESRKEKVSVGKYEVYKSSVNSNKNLTIEKIKAMKVKDLENEEFLTTKQKEKEDKKDNDKIEDKKDNNVKQDNKEGKEEKQDNKEGKKEEEKEGKEERKEEKKDRIKSENEMKNDQDKKDPNRYPNRPDEEKDTFKDKDEEEKKQENKKSTVEKEEQKDREDKKNRIK